MTAINAHGLRHDRDRRTNPAVAGQTEQCIHTNEGTSPRESPVTCPPVIVSRGQLLDVAGQETSQQGDLTHVSEGVCDQPLQAFLDRVHISQRGAHHDPAQIVARGR